MKIFLFALILVAVITDHSSPVVAQQPPVSKRIVAKLEPVYCIGSASSLRTYFYLVAEDGTDVEVPLGVYGRVKVGSYVTSRDWEICNRF